MLGNTESLLVLRFPGQPPLIVINPGARQVPAITPDNLVAIAGEGLRAVAHQATGDDFDLAAAIARWCWKLG
jgi:two-component system heavy metal sensor histidine kinase CusS